VKLGCQKVNCSEVRKSCHGVTSQERAIITLMTLTSSISRVDEDTIFCFQIFQAIGDRSNHTWLSLSCKFWLPLILEDSLYSVTCTPLILGVTVFFFIVRQTCLTMSQMSQNHSLFPAFPLMPSSRAEP
jgi:hypothetical protein